MVSTVTRMDETLFVLFAKFRKNIVHAQFSPVNLPLMPPSTI